MIQVTALCGRVGYQSLRPLRSSESPSPMRFASAFVGVFFLAAACSEMPPSRVAAPDPAPLAVAIPTAPPLHVDGETARLRVALIHEVPGLIVDTPDSERRWIAQTQTAFQGSGYSVATRSL